MKYFALTAALVGVSAAQDFDAILEQSRAKFNDVAFATAHYENSCPQDEGLGAAVWRFRKQVRTKSWCDENCRTELRKHDVYSKLVADNNGPYGCDYKFNPALQDTMDYWAHQIIDLYPEAEDLWFRLVVETQFGTDSCWERNMFNFRQWHETDINVKQFWQEAARVSNGDNSGYAAAYNYWVGDPTDATDGFRGQVKQQMINEFKSCLATGDNPTEWRNILKSNYAEMIAILGASVNFVGANSADPVFTFRLVKMLDRLSYFGDVGPILEAALVGIGYSAEAAKDISPSLLQIKGAIEFNQSSWNDFSAGDMDLNSFDFWNGVQCSQAVPAVQAAYGYLAAAFADL